MTFSSVRRLRAGGPSQQVANGRLGEGITPLVDEGSFVPPLRLTGGLLASSEVDEAETTHAHDAVRAGREARRVGHLAAHLRRRRRGDIVVIA